MAPSSPPADAGPAPSAAAPRAGGGSWVLLPLAWCLWLLAWLVPSLIAGPRVSIVSPWMETETAPAAVVAGAIFFLLAIWPFWPALAGPAEGRSLRARWLGRSLLELVILFSLAAPFGLVAWSVGGRSPRAEGLACAWLGVSLAAFGLRALWADCGPAAGRWLAFGAMLVCTAPIAIHYAANEAMNLPLPRLLEISPMIGAARPALDAWPKGDAWRTAADLYLWPAAGILCLGAGLLASRRRATPA